MAKMIWATFILYSNYKIDKYLGLFFAYSILSKQWYVSYSLTDWKMLSSEPKILGAGPSTGVTPPIPSTGELGFTASAPEIGAGLIPTTTLFWRKKYV